MPNKKTVCFATLILTALVSNIVLTLQIINLKKSALVLETKIADFDECLSEFMKQEKEVIEDIDSRISLILNAQEDMGRTYDAILEEQKKKTVDTAEKDKTFLEAKKEALSLYKKGYFSSAYIELKKLSEERKEDMTCLAYKTKSLFYMNRADSSRYAEILDDIKTLIRNAAADDECLEIQKAIHIEQGGFDE